MDTVDYASTPERTLVLAKKLALALEARANAEALVKNLRKQLAAATSADYETETEAETRLLVSVEHLRLINTEATE
jgi:hypothetical protein